MASKTYSDDPELYLYTSLTAGSSHIVTATSRMETILKANRIPFKATDLATDEKARMLWGRRAGKDESGRIRKLPALVQMGLVVGDLVEVEDWNEYGELKQHVKIVGNSNLTPVRTPAGTPSITPSKPSTQKENIKSQPSVASSSKQNEVPKSSLPQPTPITLALRQVGQEAAQKAKDNKKKPMETFSGVGKAEPPKEEKKLPEAIKTNLSEKHIIDSLNSMQSPNSTSWKTMATNPPMPLPSLDKLESLQSPNSTSWKPVDMTSTVLSNQGAKSPSASKENPREIEQEESTSEESEDSGDSGENEESEEDDEKS